MAEDFTPVNLSTHWSHYLDHRLKVTDSYFALSKTMTLQHYLPFAVGLNHPKEPFQSIEQTKKWMASKIFTSPAMVMNRSFFYAIVDKSIADAEQQVIGYMGINSVDPSPEIGYSILPESWGKGFATEALQMLLKMWWDLPRIEIDDMDRASGFVEKIYALCETCNPASGSVLRKCGFEVVKTMRFGTDELYLWSLKKSDFTHEEANKRYRYVKN